MLYLGNLHNIMNQLHFKFKKGKQRTTAPSPGISREKVSFYNSGRKLSPRTKFPGTFDFPAFRKLRNRYLSFKIYI